MERSRAFLALSRCRHDLRLQMTCEMIDMNTADGMVTHLSTLPTENLKAIAGREVFYGPVSNVLLVEAAKGILTLRGC